jgi:hypothetical protein
VDITGPHTASRICDWLRHFSWEGWFTHNKLVLIIFIDLYCFVPLKKYTADKGFATDTDVKQAVMSWLQTLVTDLFCARFRACLRV